jgi:hypothetical protein
VSDLEISLGKQKRHKREERRLLVREVEERQRRKENRIDLGCRSKGGKEIDSASNISLKKRAVGKGVKPKLYRDSGFLGFFSVGWSPPGARSWELRSSDSPVSLTGN